MNNEERRQWLENDILLYNWRISENMKIYPFIKKYRKEIDEYIEKKMNSKEGRFNYGRKYIR